MPFARPFDSNAAMTMQRAFFLFTVLFALPVAARGGWLADAWYQHTGAGGIVATGRYAVVFPIAAALPSPRLTPGATNPAVTQADIHETICVPGYTRTIRPAERYTERLKRAGIRRYGYGDRRLRDYEEDHLISLELGGSPDSPRNLWPEPHHVVGAWGSYTKDRLETACTAWSARAGSAWSGPSGRLRATGSRLTRSTSDHAPTSIAVTAMATDARPPSPWRLVPQFRPRRFALRPPREFPGHLWQAGFFC